MRIKFIASVAAALSLAFFPTAAQAVATTLEVYNSGSPTLLADGDSLEVTVAGPIAKTGPAVHELYSTWSAQSLGLRVDDVTAPEDYINWPEGWDLEYTEDGTTWVNWQTTNPTDLGAVIAIRALGDVNTVGENTFKTTSSGAVQPAPFAGSGGGDGYDATVSNGKVFNLWHHFDGVQDIPSIECHTVEGEPCATPVVSAEGYGTNHGSRIFGDATSNKVYAFVQEVSTSDFGVLCADFSTNPATLCAGSDEFTSLDALGGDNQGYGSQSQDGNIIWSIAGDSGRLMCFNIATGVACPDNGYDTTVTGNAWDTGRVTAIGGKVYFTLNDKFGCYDPATDGLCGTSTLHTLADTEHRAAPLPVEDSSGTFQGVCDMYTEDCLTSTGTTFMMDSDITSFLTATGDTYPLSKQNAAQWAYVGHRFFYLTNFGTGGSDWESGGVSCYDFLTQAACAGFDGVHPDYLVQLYTVNYSAETPDCIWTNGNAGTIVPLNITTGGLSCGLVDPVVALPYNAVTPRLACNDEGRVTQWGNIVINPLEGVAMSDVRVSFYDENGDEVVDWTDLTPNASGLIDLTGLSVNDTGTSPTIEITAGDISDELAEQITATVTFVAEDPELCFMLDAADHCTSTITNSPAAGDIADGIVTGTSITRPNAGNDVGSAQTTTLPGQNADQMCAATALTIPLPIEKLALTGVDSSSIALGGFAVLAAGGAAVAVTRRRKA